MTMHTIPVAQPLRDKRPAPTAAAVVERSRSVLKCLLIALVALVVGIPLTGLDPSLLGVSALLFAKQDAYFVPVVFAVILLRPVPLGSRIRDETATSVLTSRWAISLMIVALALACWAGHALVFDGYNLSRDEQLAGFDAYVFAHGRLMWPIDPAWRPFAPALNQLFMLPIGQHEAWISAYLPINAAFRALAGCLGDPALAGPAFVVLGALSLWRITLRLWPDAPMTRMVALVLYAGSSQIVMTGMTAYAMSAHLGLDLLWLALFLRGGKAGHAGAICVGVLATGLHQPLFHPLFVLPFLDLLRRERKWALLAIYVVAYATIGLFWLAYPIWLSAHGAGAPSHGVDYVSRLTNTVKSLDLTAIYLMALNLIRFITWQHLLFLPLLSLGFVAARRDPFARALAIGLVLPVVAMAILLPSQGHGWGYRYLHGVLGNACLLGAFGWCWLETNGLSFRRAFLWTSVATFGIGVPVHAAMAHRMVEPYFAASRAIRAIDADLVVVDDLGAPWANDLVLNRPDLGNHPILLLGGQLWPETMGTLCRGRTIAFFGGARLDGINALFDKKPAPVTADQRALEDAARRGRCDVIQP